jgi:hypothetical protein
MGVTSIKEQRCHSRPTSQTRFSLPQRQNLFDCRHKIHSAVHQLDALLRHQIKKLEATPP